jgi:hypothetical protein
LKAGGRLYFADAHPAAWSLDDPAEDATDRRPVLRYAYFGDGRPDIWDEAGDYADEHAVVENSVTWEWPHPTSEVLTALLDAGLRLDFFHEHPVVPWRMFEFLEPAGEGLWGWPDEHWLPLTFSLGATRV